MARPRSTPWPTGPRAVFFGDVASPPTIARAVREGRIRRIAPRVYTADLASAAEEVVAHNRWAIISELLPGSLIADRSAAEDGRIVSGRFFVVSNLPRRTIRLPGLEVRVRPGLPFEEPVADLLWAEGLRMSSPARILLDNLSESRSRDGQAARTLTLAELEDWLARKALAWGRERIDELHHQTIRLAEVMDVKHRLAEVEQLFGQVTGRLPLRAGSGRYMRAFARGGAWDERRVSMFERAAADLAQVDLETVTAGRDPVARAGELPFYESYFSNFIEGTEFTVDEARTIVETQQPPASRPADGHDILGTYHCVVDPIGRGATSDDPDRLCGLLTERHRSILRGRPEHNPGRFKTLANRVGAYDFVAPELVEATLRKGLALMADLPAGFSRALFMMFVVSEVHPFSDGNGRVARVMMNAELSAVDESRIVVPSVFREEYLGGLRRASNHHGDMAGLIRVMAFAWRWTAAMPWDDRADTDGRLVATNALLDSGTARDRGLRLELP